MGSDRLAFALRLLFALLLIALAAWERGEPSVATALLHAGATALAVALRAVVRRGRGGLAALHGPARLAAAELALAVVVALRGSDGPADLVWLFLVGVPLALRVAAEEPLLVPRTRAKAALLLGSVALGLVGAAPWDDAVGRLLLGALVLTGTIGGALEATRRLLPPGLPAPAPAAWRRLVATVAVVALLSLLLGVVVDVALSPLTRSWNEPPPPASDRLAARLQPPLAGSASDSIALVRLVSQGELEEERPPRLYLRERVYDALVEGDGLVYLGPAAGKTRFVRDEHDERDDGRVATLEPSELARAEPRYGSVFKITLLSDSPVALLQVAAPIWIEGESAAIAADASIERAAGQRGTYTYHVGASPRLATAPPARALEFAAADPLGRALPESFLDRPTLSKLAETTVANAANDGERAARIVALLAADGRVDRAAPFRSWTDFATRRAGAPLHFAQCAALLLRLARLPARVVSGYACDRFDAAERHWDVRASDAHWWVEVAFEEAGFVLFDPVPRQSADEDRAKAAALAEQEAAARRDRLSKRSLQNTVQQHRPLVVGIALLLGLAAFFAFPTVRSGVAKLLTRRGPPGISLPARRAWRFWQELIDRCRRSGLPVHPSWTAAEFTGVVSRAAPSIAGSLGELLRLYHAGRFGGVELQAQDEARVRAILLGEVAPALAEWREQRAAIERDRR